MSDLVTKIDANIGANMRNPPSPKFILSLLRSGMEQEARIIEKKWGLRPLVLTTTPAGIERVGFVNTEKILDQFITQDPKMLELKEQVRILANVDDSVLIHGETGTGKELIAEALNGARNGRFIDMNCAAMPDELFESELFGHVKGAFTGADKDTDGLVECAKDGTLFLDEVGDLPLPLQATLLRVMQRRTYRAVGGKETKTCNCRFVAASHHNIPDLVRDGKFRLDLYSRLSVFELKTTPLRTRLSDINLIIDSLDPEKKFPRGVNWESRELRLNVRDIQRIVRRFQVLGVNPMLA